MKITMNIDCSPEEARAFLGLPDAEPIQRSMMEHMQTRIEKAAAAMDPERFLKMMFPFQSEGGLADMPRAFWERFMPSRANPNSNK